MEFIAVSPISKKVFKLAQMVKEMDINVYIYGEKGSGKTFLANFIANKNDEIIENIKTLPNTNKRIIATGKNKLYDDLSEFFPIQIELKPLSQRKEDIPAFINYFKNEIKKEFDITKEINIDYNNENIKQLKQKIYKKALCEDYDKNSIIEILETFFENNYKENDSYSSMLKIFDTALINTLLKKYKSKLQVAKILKINRNTLSKKVKEIEN